MRRILVMCYGNIYRSAFLGEYLRQHASGLFEVRSAGFYHKSGRSSPPRHVAMAAALDVDLSAHRSKQVSAEDIEWADVVVIMDADNWLELRKLNVPHDKPTIWAGALTNGPLEIRDPYEMSDETAAAIVQRLATAGAALLRHLRDGVRK